MDFNVCVRNIFLWTSIVFFDFGAVIVCSEFRNNFRMIASPVANSRPHSSTPFFIFHEYIPLILVNNINQKNQHYAKCYILRTNCWSVVEVFMVRYNYKTYVFNSSVVSDIYLHMQFLKWFDIYMTQKILFYFMKY